VVNARQGLSDGGSVGNHAHSSLDTGKVTTRNHSRRLVVDTALEASRAPIDELHSSLGLDGSDSGVHVLGDNITSEHHAAGHELTVARIALSKHVGRFEDSVGDLGNRELLVVRLLGRDDRCVRGKHKMNTGVWHQVGLELSNIDVKGTIEAKRSSEGRHDLTDETVEVGVGRSLDIKRSSAHVVEGLIIETECAVGVLKKRVR
jgi:hypothetical protein